MRQRTEAWFLVVLTGELQQGTGSPVPGTEITGPCARGCGAWCYLWTQEASQALGRLAQDGLQRLRPMPFVWTELCQGPAFSLWSYWTVIENLDSRVLSC